MLVTTSRPILAVIARAVALSAPAPTPMVVMNRSTPRFQVASVTTEGASSHEEATCVAPRASAVSFFSTAGSIATITRAPASFPPWMAAARARDRHGGPRADVGGVDGGTPAGHEPAAQQAGSVQRHRWVDLHHAGL